MIVGDSGEAALVAALAHAARWPGKTDAADASVWVTSLDAAAHVLDGAQFSEILVDDSAFGEALPAIGTLARITPVRSVRSELESRFGRVDPSVEETVDQFERTIPRRSPVARAVRRSAELFVSAVMLIVAAPLLILLSVLYRIVFGPSHFLKRHQLVGAFGAPITIVEFAPRPVDASVGSRTDRVSISIDRNLRRAHLNGVPALVHVLSGQLSLVGPVPVSRDILDQAIAENPLFEARILVRPGLISLARVRLRQVRSDYDRIRAFEYDLYYLRHWSLERDARILGRASLILGSDVLVTAGRMVRTAAALTYATVHHKMVGRRPGASALAIPHGWEASWSVCARHSANADWC